MELNAALYLATRAENIKYFIASTLNIIYSFCSQQENLTLPSIAIASYLKSVDFNKTAYCVTCPETIAVLKSYGIKCQDGVSKLLLFSFTINPA